MKLKPILESLFAGMVAATFTYIALSLPATLVALAIRRKMPTAWFSSSVTWYALGVVLTASAAAAGVASRMVYKRGRSKPSKTKQYR